jgi:fluoride exporter
VTPVLLSLAGGAGALARFVADGLVRTRLGRIFPWGTFLINISGSLLLGIIAGLVLHHHASATFKLILGTGFCGGYTTFSTASFETVRLIEEQRFWSAVLYAGGGLLCILAAAAIGLAVT